MKALVVVMAIAASILGSCSTYRITRNQADKSASWSAYQTFAFVDTNRIEALPGGSYQATIEDVKKAVVSELSRRGYQQTSDNPDLLVNIGAVVNEKTQTRQTTIYEAPIYTGQRRYRWQSQEVPVGTYQEGTVNLHIVDAQRNALIWDVAVSSVLARKGVTSAQIDEAIRKVFDKFPGKRP